MDMRCNLKAVAQIKLAVLRHSTELIQTKKVDIELFDQVRSALADDATVDLP